MLAVTDEPLEGFPDVGRGRDAVGTLANRAEYKGNIYCKAWPGLAHRLKYVGQ